MLRVLSHPVLDRPSGAAGGACLALARLSAMALVLALSLWLAVASARAAGAARPAGAAPVHSFDTVAAMARALAAAPYAPAPPVDKALADLTYDEWRDIRFRPEASLWRGEGLPVEVQFFHPGFVQRATVRLNVVEAGRAAPLALSRDMFDYGRNQAIAPRMPKTVGAAGFRIHGAINRPDYFDEYLVFLGASYFRAVAKGQHYGLSARGLAVDTALPRPEEFPVFREFWLHKPAPGDAFVDVDALMDSPSVAGAYTFRIRPGERTEVAVRARLFFRKRVEKLGLAPLTSMFLYGENTLPGPLRDWRPEVHDSDGLLMHTGRGEWIWRPLRNPARLEVNLFRDENPKGFGLLQRDRDYRDYLDLEADMERRPSLWIEPGEGWGKGHVELFLIPSVEEINDNVAAYWSPDAMPEAGGELAFSYRMSWHDAPDGRPGGGARVAATRTARLPGLVRQMIVEFEGGALPAKTAADPVAADVWVGEGGTLVETQCFRNDVTGGWRVAFKVALDHPGGEGGPPVEMRAFLRQGEDVLSETWSYAVEP
ncbi:MAG: glucan biosynthesis protein [Desulfovibrionaceae bacterium]